MSREGAQIGTDGPLRTLAVVVAVVTLPFGMYAETSLASPSAGLVFLVGWLILVPVLSILAEYLDPRLAARSDPGPRRE